MMKKNNKVWAGLQMYIGLLVVVIGSSVEAAVYHIDSQSDFDYYKEAEFRPGDTIAFKREKIALFVLRPMARAIGRSSMRWGKTRPVSF